MIRRARWVGRGVLAMAVLALVINAVWIARHWDQLRPIARGDIARPFELPRADGTGTVALDDLRGQVVLIDFWAAWCRPCVDSMPAVQRIYERFHKRGFEVISVNTEDPEDAPKALAFARRLGLTFPIVMDDGVVASSYGASTIPYLVLVDHHGVVRSVHRGTTRDFEANLSSQVESLVRALP